MYGTPVLYFHFGQKSSRRPQLLFFVCLLHVDKYAAVFRCICCRLCRFANTKMKIINDFCSVQGIKQNGTAAETSHKTIIYNRFTFKTFTPSARIERRYELPAGDIFKQSTIKDKIDANTAFAALIDGAAQYLNAGVLWGKQFEGFRVLCKEQQTLIYNIIGTPQYIRLVQKLAYNLAKIYVLSLINTSEQNKRTYITRDDFKQIRIKATAVYNGYKYEDKTTAVTYKNMLNIFLSLGLLDDVQTDIRYHHADGTIKSGRSYVVVNKQRIYDNIIKPANYRTIAGNDAAHTDENAVQKIIQKLCVFAQVPREIQQLRAGLEFDVRQARQICRASVGATHKGETITAERAKEWGQRFYECMYNYSYFTQQTGRRTHGLTNVPSKLRPCITYHGQHFYEIDGKNSQPTLLAALLKQNGIDAPQYTADVESGQFYEIYGQMIGESDRSRAKIKAFTNIFFSLGRMRSTDAEQLTARYGAPFVEFLQRYRHAELTTAAEIKAYKDSPARDKTRELWYLLQSLEAEIWNKINDANDNCIKYQIYDAICVIGEDNARTIANDYQQIMKQEYGITAAVHFDVL